jgi:hypothetical protein
VPISSYVRGRARASVQVNSRQRSNSPLRDSLLRARAYGRGSAHPYPSPDAALALTLRLVLVSIPLLFLLRHLRPLPSPRAVAPRQTRTSRTGTSPTRRGHLPAHDTAAVQVRACSAPRRSSPPATPPQSKLPDAAPTAAAGTETGVGTYRPPHLRAQSMRGPMDRPSTESLAVARPRTTAAPTPGARWQPKPTTLPSSASAPLPVPKATDRSNETTAPLPRRHHARPERRRHARPKA